MVKSDVVAFLLSSEPWSSYRARLDLLGEAADSAGATADRARMMASPPVARLIADVGDWPGPVLERHDKAPLLIHELAHLADIGLNRGDPGMADVAERALARILPEGPPEIVVNIPRSLRRVGTPPVR